MDRFAVNQLTVDRLTGRQVDRFICYLNMWYQVVKSCSPQVDIGVVNQMMVDRLTGRQVDRF